MVYIYAAMTTAILDLDMASPVLKELLLRLDLDAHQNGRWCLTYFSRYSAHNMHRWMDGISNSPFSLFYGVKRINTTVFLK